LQKDRESAARVLAPKVRGTLVLESVFQLDSIDFFILMSSVSSHLAPAGQVDYTAANAFLDSFAKSRLQQSPRYISIHWPRWADVGMAAEKPSGQMDAVHPLLGRKTGERDGLTTYSTTLSLGNDWIVSEHRLSIDTGLFPATGYLEMVRAAVMDLTGATALSVNNFYVSRPLRVKTDLEQPLRLLMRKEGEAYRFSARTRANGLQAWIECASGEVIVSPAPPEVSRLEIDSILRKCNDRTIGLDHPPRNEGQERHIEFGARWRNLKRVWLGRGELFSLLELPSEFSSEIDTYRLHPALLDMATGSALFLIKGNDAAGYLYVPISYGSVLISGPLPAACYSYVRSKAGVSIESPIATFDVTVVDREGNTIVEVRDFSVRQIRDVALLEDASPALSAEVANTEGLEAIDEHKTAQPSDAISSEEGGRAFARVLANARISSVIVFPYDFAAYIDRQKPRRAVIASERNVEAPADNPNEEVEVTLTRWWKELLGVDAVSSQDNFFDTGGQSLTGVRLLAKVKRKYGVDLKLATLFSAPTIEKLCALVRNQTSVPSFHSLIEIQPKGTKPPLFLIHEIEGSVMVFRDFVKHFDRDQPIWGVEYSVRESSSPLLRMEDLAAYYLEEIRKLQPRGPYYLLGYSFGGLLAFEIAQQLYAAGQRVELLGMLDTFLMNGVRTSAQKRTLRERVKRKVGSFGRHVGRVVFGPQRRAYLREDLAERLDATIGQGRQLIYGVLRARGRSIPKFLHRAKDVNWFAALRYEAQPYPGRVTLFRATTPLSFIDMPTDRELGWGSLAEAGVEVHEIPGTHREIMREPNVSIVAREVSGCLAEASERQLHLSNVSIWKESVGPRVSSRYTLRAEGAGDVP
jgi:thioesterase domain-containing protein/aryl carrier-like protein